MKVILLQDIKSVGKKGQILDASDGYARNYLLPKKLAVIADATNLNGINSSFVLCENENKVHVSGRSNGSLNVQVILEKFGGGGHMMIAGAQIENKSIEEVKNMLVDAIKELMNAKE